MSRALLLTLSIFATGCATPKYEIRLAPITSNPSHSREHALSICAPQARMAKSKAQADVQAKIDAENNRVTGYKCDTSGILSGTLYQGSTQCVPKTAGQERGMFGVVTDATAANSAGNEAANYALSSCLAQYGWKVETYCVSNCR